jgi:ABC-2 type transport system permease protein
MAVHDRGFKAYSGTLTPEWTRFLVVPRYAYREVFKSRLFTGFLFLSFVIPFIAALFVYLHHNASVLEMLQMPVDELFPIDASFFRTLLAIQAGFGFVLTLVVGPALVSPDLRHNGLPLYLCRPFTRVEYVLGKFSVLAILLSAVTWVAPLAVYFLQAYLEGFAWLMSNLRIAMALVVGASIWLIVMSLLALALSAWVKWKTLARFAFIVVFFVLAGFGQIINALFRIRWGSILDIGELFASFWAGLFGLPRGNHLSMGVAFLVLAGVALFSLALLWRRLRAYEVVT